MEHSFNTDLAKELGIPEAVILHNIYFWTEKNSVNGKHFYDGYTWVYNTKNAWSELFPYLSSRQIDYILKGLINKGVLQQGNYNKSQYDRTLWYAFTEKGISILQNCGFHFTKLVNAFDKFGKSIIDNKQDNKKENNINIIPEKTNNSSNVSFSLENSLDNVNPVVKPKRETFKRPTIDEIREYCDSRNNGIDAERFFDFYESKGWKVGNTPMKDWKACVRTWEKKNGTIVPKVETITIEKENKIYED